MMINFMLLCVFFTIISVVNALHARKVLVSNSDALRFRGGQRRLFMSNGPDRSKLPWLHWSDYPNDDYDHILGINDPKHVPSKLQQITALRIADTLRSKKPIDTQGCGIDRSFYASSETLEEEIKEFDEVYGPPLNLADRISSTFPHMAIAAEFKRASPSKGDINPDLDVVHQCLQYDQVGAAVISVLTEYLHFKGTLNDMKRVRLATQAAHKQVADVPASPRPAILRKDFILDRYQILEARSHGADTILLIVAILGVNQLKDLIQFSRKFGMEPLVEVHTEREMEIALECGSRVIGVNNRNLHTFKLDLETTKRAVNVAARQGLEWRLNEKTKGSFSSQSSSHSSNILIAALSGITSSSDVQQFREIGVSCVLVGETLMKASDPKATIACLLADPTSSSAGSDKDNNHANDSNASNGGLKNRKIVKTCGIRNTKDAQVALQAGASMLGVIFASRSTRRASIDEARAIVELTRSYGERSSSIDLSAQVASLSSLSPQAWYSSLIDTLSIFTVRKPLVVGVFQDQSAGEINHIIAETGIDLVQLHGNESPEFVDQIKGASCIKVLHVDAGTCEGNGESTPQKSSLLLSQANAFAGRAVALLVDSKVPGQAGGTGATFDWSLTEELSANNIPFILAGGLTGSNVANAVKLSAVRGVDVASGVEESAGVKNEKLVKEFIANARL